MRMVVFVDVMLAVGLGVVSGVVSGLIVRCYAKSSDEKNRTEVINRKIEQLHKDLDVGYWNEIERLIYYIFEVVEYEGYPGKGDPNREHMDTEVTHLKLRVEDLIANIKSSLILAPVEKPLLVRDEESERIDNTLRQVLDLSSSIRSSLWYAFMLNENDPDNCVNPRSGASMHLANMIIEYENYKDNRYEIVEGSNKLNDLSPFHGKAGRSKDELHQRAVSIFSDVARKLQPTMVKLRQTIDEIYGQDKES